MRYVVYGVLVAMSFLVGWQLEHSVRLERLSELGAYEFCGKSAIGLDDGYFDILVRDNSGNWRTLAFAAQVYQGYVKVHKKDERIIATVDSELRYRKTLQPGSTFVCDNCAKFERHEVQQSITRRAVITELPAYECPTCRLRICPVRAHFPAREYWRLIGDFRSQQRFFPTAPKVAQNDSR